MTDKVETDIVILHTTASSEDEASQISKALVNDRLAACVQIQGPIRSRYRWQGKLEESQEWLCTAKTTKARMKNAADRIREVHPYDEPEIVATAVVYGSDGYLQWVRDSVEP